VRRLANPVALVAVAALGMTSLAAAGVSSGGPTVSATCATVGTGATGPAVATLQRAVGAAADGDYGPATAAAVQSWQHRHHVRVTGVIDAATWKALPSPVAVAACGQRVSGSGVDVSCAGLALHSVGPAVALLQRRIGGLAVDGGFGPRTGAAVVAAQHRLALPATGTVDAATWAALGLTGTPACVAASAVKAAAVTPAPAPTAAPTPPPAPQPPADAAQQAKVRAQVLALTAGLAAKPGQSNNPFALAAMHFAQTQIGKPYKWAGVGPDAYDCSGLVLASYAAAGITTPRVAADQYGFGTSVPIDQAQQGDLLFYAMDLTKPATIHHVVMYVGSGKVLDAPYTGAYVGIRPLWTNGLLPVAWRPFGGLTLPVGAGSTGATVAQVQQALDRHGAGLAVDGGYGPATAAAVKAWQSAHKLSATGATDVATLLSLGVQPQPPAKPAAAKKH
jgi:cell wall-associated NlpC family hydrolase